MFVYECIFVVNLVMCGFVNVLLIFCGVYLLCMILVVIV